MSYKKRKIRPPPIREVIECPACGWKSKRGRPDSIDKEYLIHLNTIHIGPLDCVFCGVPFESFASLAEHVKGRHPQERANLTGEVNDMNKQLPDPGRGERTKKLPEPESGDYNPFITVSDLPKSGKAVLVLTGTTRDASSQFGEGIVVEVKLSNKIFDWTIRYKSGNYPRLYKKFGSDPSKWRGRVSVEVKEFSGNDYIAVA